MTENTRAIDPADVSVINFDNDTAGVTIQWQTERRTTEAGGTAAFTVVLDTQPIERGHHRRPVGQHGRRNRLARTVDLHTPELVFGAAGDGYGGGR